MGLRNYVSRKGNAEAGVEIAPKEGNHSSFITHDMSTPTGRLVKEPGLKNQDSLSCPGTIHTAGSLRSFSDGEEENSRALGAGRVLESPGERLRHADIHLQRLV